MSADYVWLDSLHNQLAAAPPDSITSQTLLKNAWGNVSLFVFDAGQGLSEHQAKQAALLQIIDGEAEIMLGGDLRQARAGSWVFMPPQLPHAITAKTRLTMLLTLLPEQRQNSAERETAES